MTLYAHYETGIIYDNGTMVCELTTEGYNFAYDTTAYYRNLGVTQWSPSIPICISGNYAEGTVFGTANKINVSDYNTLNVTIDNQVLAIDVSSIQGDYYVWVAWSRYYTYSSNTTLNASHVCFGLSSTKNCVMNKVAWYRTTTSANYTIYSPKYVSKIELVK